MLTKHHKRQVSRKDQPNIQKDVVVISPTVVDRKQNAHGQDGKADRQDREPKRQYPKAQHGDQYARSNNRPLMCKEIAQLVFVQTQGRRILTSDRIGVIEDIPQFIERKRSQQNEYIMQRKQCPRTRIADCRVECGRQDVEQQPRQQLRQGAKPYAIQIPEGDIERRFNICFFLFQ